MNCYEGLCLLNFAIKDDDPSFLYIYWKVRWNPQFMIFHSFNPE